MSAIGFTPIQLFRTTTASAAPSAGNLADGELAINLTDEKLYFKNAAGVVKLLASNAGSEGTVTSVDVSGGTTGLTTSGGPITGSGTITLGGTLIVANGGTGATTLSANGVLLGNGTSAVTAVVGTTGRVLTGNTGSAPTFEPISNLAVSSISFGSTGLTPATATTGAVTVGGTLIVANGGTGATTFTANRLLRGNGTGALQLAGIFDQSSAEAMRIDSSGNVGIGTTAPANRLAVQNDTAPTFFDTTLDNTAMLICVRGAGLNNFGASLGFSRLDSSGRVNAAIAIKQTSADSDQCGLSFFTHSSASTGASLLEAMSITHAGNVGIGTTAPGGKAHISSISSGTVPATLILSNTVANSAGTGADLRFYVNDGGSERYAAVRSVQATSGNFADLRFITSNSDTPTERMRIDSAGNVGIGTTAPSAKLAVNGDGGASLPSIFAGTAGYVSRTAGTTSFCGFSIISGNASTAALNFGDTDDEDRGSIQYLHNVDDMRFITSANERMRIDSAGRVLVATTAALDFASTTTPGNQISSTGVSISRSGAPSLNIQRTTSDGGIASFWRNNTQVGSISVTTTATAYNTSSDYRLKDIDGPIANSGAYIDALKPVQGSWKADGSRFIGLLAHEAQEVSETQIATGEKDGEEMQAMDYSAPEIIANLIAEIQSLRARVAQLEGS